MKLKKAIKYLEDVLEHKNIIPFRRHTGCIGRKAQVKMHQGTTQGRYPEKSVNYVIGLLKNVHANAEAKGLDVDKCVVSHVAV